MSMSRILAVDPGSKNLGIALSDPSGTIANPLKVLRHVSKSANAAAVLSLAEEHSASLIVIGQSLDPDGQPTFEGRRAARLAAEIGSLTELEILLWDESHSTAAAREAQVAMGTPRRKRQGHLDELAATVILQSYLDSRETQL
jgi:putative Holliday junction resolvase